MLIIEKSLLYVKQKFKQGFGKKLIFIAFDSIQTKLTEI